MTKRIRLALGLGLVVFMVLAGTVTASALWLTQVSATSTVRVANLDDACVNITSVVNASFETPNIQTAYGASISQTPESAVEGWMSTPEHIIEIWNQNNYLGVVPPVGNQFVELNASVAGTLSQTITTTPGQTLQWSLLHRGRDGVDTMDVLIGPAGGTQVSQGNITDGNTAWVRYSGAYVVPVGQTSTQISFRAVSTGGSGDQSIGNFLDDVSFGSGPCVQASSTATNFTNPGGLIRVGDRVEYITTVKNIGSSPSFQSVLTNTLPANMTYVAGSMQTGTSIATLGNRTDANDTNDTAKYVGTTTTAYLGTSATSTVGGSIAQGTEQVFRFLATAAASNANGTVVAYTPTVNYVNMLAPQWGKTITAANAPVTIYNGTDIVVASALTPALGTATTTNNAEWTFSVGNIGNLAATSTTVRITLPANMAGATVMRNTTAGGAVATNCTTVITVPVGTTRDCVFDTGILAGGTRTISIKLTVTPGAAATGTAYTVGAAVTAAVPADYNAANNTATNTATVADTTAPTTPGTPVASNTTANGTTLTWTASTDNVAVARYNVFRGGVLIGSVNAPTLTYTDTTATALTVNAYTIQAEDAAGNDSANTGIVRVLTRPDTAGNYAFRNNNGTGGKCVSTLNTATAALLTADCAATSATQQFRFVATSNGYYTIASLNNQARIWDIVAGTGNTAYTANSRPVRVADPGTAALQNQWMPRLASDNVSIEFYNPNSGRCLDVPSASVNTGVQFQLYDCNNTVAQQFTPTRTN